MKNKKIIVIFLSLFLLFSCENNNLNDIVSSDKNIHHESINSEDNKEENDETDIMKEDNIGIEPKANLDEIINDKPVQKNVENVEKLNANNNPTHSIGQEKILDTEDKKFDKIDNQMNIKKIEEDKDLDNMLQNILDFIDE